MIFLLADSRHLIKWHSSTSELRWPNNENKMSTFPFDYVAIDDNNSTFINDAYIFGDL